jgi:hypothetical protein
MSNYCFVAPILPGGVDKMKSWIEAEVYKYADHDRVILQVGISRVQVWVQPTPLGDFAISSFETEDAGKAFQVLTTSNDPCAAKFRDLLSKAHGIDFSQPMPLKEQVADWHAMVKIRA